MGRIELGRVCRVSLSVIEPEGSSARTHGTVTSARTMDREFVLATVPFSASTGSRPVSVAIGNRRQARTSEGHRSRQPFVTPAA